MRLLGLGITVSLVLGGLMACTGDQGDVGPAGPNGNNGDPAIAVTSPEPAGAHCVSGGIKIQVGVDDNNDGTLQPEEVDATSYVCNGTDGTVGTNGTNGHNALVKTSAEPGGANCPFGGTKIETGFDANDNAVLDAGEVNAAATSYVCNIAPSGSISPSTGIVVSIKSVSTTAPITVRFTMKDDRGFPLDKAGGYSVNTAIQPRFSLGYFTKDAVTGTVSPLTTYTKTNSTTTPALQPTNYNPATAATYGTLTEVGLGAGDYSYTFPVATTNPGPAAVAYDPAKLNETHVMWMQVTRQTDLIFPTNANTFYADNPSYYFIPSGTGVVGKREIVAQANCDACHAKFKAETTTSAAFHGGGRVNAGMCNVCHSPDRVSNLLANSASFVHRIHNGEDVAVANRFHAIAATYPRDIRACDTCHVNAAQGGQSLSNPSRIACQGCHDYVSFTTAAAVFCGVGGTVNRGPDGLPIPCNHVGGAQANDSTCAGCHGAAGGFPVANYHKPVAKPDPANLWRTGGTNANTNASYVAAGGYVPAGADVITYDLKSVDTWTDVTVTPNLKRPSITFKLKKNGVDVVFQTYAPAATPPVTELMPNFVGSPSAYFVFAMPQDNITAPADFNASASGYIRSIWNGTATGTSAGTLTGPDATGYYTIKLTGVQLPASAVMLTGGLGYTYALSGTAPLVQTNVVGYPWTPNVPADGKAQGGLSVPAPNVWKVATGYTARRTIVDNAKCKACHGTLGVTPNFHAGHRNDGPTCSWCHNPNRTSSGWSAGSKSFVHAIHAGRKRTVPFTWHAVAVGPGYGEVEFPGTLNTCTTCHVANTYDFTNATNLNSLPNQELSTVATGVYNIDPLVNSTYYTISPYVVADGVTSYGAGFAFNAGTGVTTQAAGTTLVNSQLTGACSACHDSTIAISHMRSMGGLFYAPRSSVPATGTQEQCMICHGPGRIAAVGLVHQR